MNLVEFLKIKVQRDSLSTVRFLHTLKANQTNVLLLVEAKDKNPRQIILNLCSLLVEIMHSIMSIMRAKKIILLFSFFPLKASSVSGLWTSSTGGDAFVSQSSFMKLKMWEKKKNLRQLFLEQIYYEQNICVSVCVIGTVVFPGTYRRQIVNSKCLVKGETVFVLVTRSFLPAR